MSSLLRDCKLIGFTGKDNNNKIKETKDETNCERELNARLLCSTCSGGRILVLGVLENITRKGNKMDIFFHINPISLDIPLGTSQPEEGQAFQHFRSCREFSSGMSQKIVFNYIPTQISGNFS